LRLRRLDDYQGWAIEHAGALLLIDPWLTSEPIRGVFDRARGPAYTDLAAIRDGDATVVGVLLCAGVDDHARPETLAALREVPVLGPAAAVRVSRRVGALHATRAVLGTAHTFPARGGAALRVTPTRTGWPLGWIANGYLVEGLMEERVIGRVWFEPHQPSPHVASTLGPVDAAVLPCDAVHALVLPVAYGLTESLRAAKACRAKVLVPTATDPRRDMSGWQRALYRVRGPEHAMWEAAVAQGRIHPLAPQTAMAIGPSSPE
jgi:L-ascorbate metabolism protein UlaG (beta-lactamase superfamily)